jgi:geranyl-CoA carboxylase alpha subunit
MTPIRTILVANRGEIAVRIMRTAKAMGFRTAAVYSDADAHALHVQSADIATRVGPADVRASYLDIDAIIKAARRVDADAIHPGYGFLSENADFALAVADAGLVFIGPTPQAIAAMGNKAAAKRRMIAAGVPCVPGFEGENASDARLVDEGHRIGFPLMVKAAAGGGGRGMRLVHAAHELAGAIATARSEALNAFGSDELILERAVVDARHVEIQVLADAHGTCLHLGERDCSVQRRHQKVLEEAPSPAVDAARRTRMGEAAVAAARAIGYTNAGTVEFLLGADGQFYFLEMNTRLQVEHPVTEMVTGLDLVELQIRAAQGEPLPLAQGDVRLSGHAIEARLYAEAPEKGFLPQSGALRAWRAPSGHGVRVDHGLLQRQEVTPHYDPMLAKIIAHGATREEARRRLVEALRETEAAGIMTNRTFLIDCLQHPDFVAGAATTQFIPAHFAEPAAAQPDAETLALCAVLLFVASAQALGHAADETWSSSGAVAWPMKLAREGVEGKPESLTVGVPRAGHFLVTHGSVAHEIEVALRDGSVTWHWQGRARTARWLIAGDVLHLTLADASFSFRDVTYAPPSAGEGAGSGEIRAPMNGKIVAVYAAVGDRVEKGQRILVLEAMKMQHELVAQVAGTLAQLAVKPGDQVATRQVLAVVTAG